MLEQYWLHTWTRIRETGSPIEFKMKQSKSVDNNIASYRISRILRKTEFPFQPVHLNRLVRKLLKLIRLWFWQIVVFQVQNSKFSKPAQVVIINIGNQYSITHSVGLSINEPIDQNLLLKSSGRFAHLCSSTKFSSCWSAIYSHSVAPSKTTTKISKRCHHTRSQERLRYKCEHNIGH